MSEPVDLQADGVLWLINRVVFHPRGFALALMSDGSFDLQGDGTEPWSMPARVDDQKFAAVEALFDRARADATTLDQQQEET